jgi:hypothetical protein
MLWQYPPELKTILKCFQDKGQSVYSLEGRTDTIPEEVTDVIQLEEHQTSEGSEDSGLMSILTIQHEFT